MKAALVNGLTWVITLVVTFLLEAVVIAVFDVHPEGPVNSAIFLIVLFGLPTVVTVFRHMRGRK